jgi:hypothetical protein
MSGGRVNDLTYEGSNIVTDTNGYKAVTLTGNYSGKPFVSVTAGGQQADNVIAYITDIVRDGSSWVVHFRTSMGEQACRYHAWGPIRETF